MADSITVSRAAARRFLVSAFALDRFQSLPDVPAAIDQLQFVQEDSINICGRIHDLILWPRVRDYAPTDLRDALYRQPRKAFEYYFPNLCVLPLRDYPYFKPAMDERAISVGRWQGLTEEEIPIAERILATIDSDGPLRTRSTGSEDGHGQSGWGTRTSKAAIVVDKLWLHGRLTVSHRENFERYFDRTERLLPDLGSLGEIDPAAIEPYKALKRARARRLFRLKAADREALGTNAFTAVTIEGMPGRPWFVLNEDVEALRAAAQTEVAAEAEPEADAVFFLAPLDPLVYDRERDKALWDFDYTWEVYTPAAKRQWGYYVLPILQGDRLIGRIDPKIDRKTGTLNVVSLTFEPGVDKMAVAAAVAGRLAPYSRFLGAERVDLPDNLPKLFRKRLERNLK